MRRLVPVLAAVAAGCGGARPTVGTASLRPACAAAERWDGHGCVARGAGAAEVAAGAAALAAFQVADAVSALDRAAAAGPLDHASYVRLWEQRGIAEAYLEHADQAAAAFDMLLALDPGHLLSYTLSPKATFVFERERAAGRRATELDVDWPHGLQVGQPVPVDVEVVADPRHLLDRATLFVRRRGETAWRAADLALPAAGAFRRVVLPPADGQKPASLEIYLRAYDRAGNEVLTWADPARPREIPLAYTPPAPWWRKWWVWAAAGSAVAIGTGAGVYATTRSPPDRLGGTVTVP